MSLYRKKALEKLQSPDRVDELLQVVHRRDWIVLSVFGLLFVAAVAWGIFGRIPITAEGHAVLLRPSTVLGFQSPAAGQLVSWKVNVGDRVDIGAPLAVLERPALVRALDEARLELAELESQHDQLGRLSSTTAELERTHADGRRSFLMEQLELEREELERTRALAIEVRDTTLDVLAEEERTTTRLRRRARSLGADLRERVQAYVELEERGLASEASLVDAREAAVANELRQSELELQLREVERRRLQAEQEHRAVLRDLSERRSAIADMELQLRELDLSEAELRERDAESRFELESRLSAARRTVASLEAELQGELIVRSDQAGTVLELVVAEGERIDVGHRLGTLDVGATDERLACLAYFEVKDGKKLRAGMTVQVAPDSVQRERFGSVVGRVGSVSGYPVSTEAAAQAIGNAALAGRITAEGRQIEVHASLEPDASTTSGFRWTSRGGPEGVLTAGTTGLVTVTVEERRPVSFVIPLLREATGIGSDPRDRS